MQEILIYTKVKKYIEKHCVNWDAKINSRCWVTPLFNVQWHVIKARSILEYAIFSVVFAMLKPDPNFVCGDLYKGKHCGKCKRLFIGIIIVY